MRHSILRVSAWSNCHTLLDISGSSSQIAFGGDLSLAIGTVEDPETSSTWRCICQVLWARKVESGLESGRRIDGPTKMTSSETSKSSIQQIVSLAELLCIRGIRSKGQRGLIP